MFKIARLKVSAVMAAIMAFTSFGMASAQLPAYQTSLVTSVTYQNVGTAAASVNFAFYNQKDGTAINVARTLPQGAGDSLFVGGLTGTEALPEGFLGSAVLSSNQPVVATAVQIPDTTSTTVKNRPLSNGFSSGNANVLLATVLKNKFNTTSTFSIQNADTGNIDITLKIFNADDTAAAPVTITETNIPQGAAKTYDMGTLGNISANVFNGSATVTAVKSGTTTPANIVASVLEFSTVGGAVKAFEGVTEGANTVFMATALCDRFNPLQRTAYAVQNTSTSETAAVTVSYSNGVSENANIGPGAKKSFNACNAPGAQANFTGAATITSSGAPIIVIGKAFFNAPDPAGFETAFLGESVGSAKLALPYVRYASDAKYLSGSRQRTNIAIQNIGSAAVSNVTVQYLNKNGTVVGTHTIASIAPGAKANSSPVSAGSGTALEEFGSPDANPGGGFGGAAVITAPAGSQLIAIGRVSSSINGNLVAEDYNAMDISGN